MSQEFTLTVPLLTARQAQIMHQTLLPDIERNKDCIITFQEQENLLKISFSTSTVRLLRLHVNSVLESAKVCVETMEVFG